MGWKSKSGMEKWDGKVSYLVRAGWKSVIEKNLYNPEKRRNSQNMQKRPRFFHKVESNCYLQIVLLPLFFKCPCSRSIVQRVIRAVSQKNIADVHFNENTRLSIFQAF